MVYTVEKIIEDLKKKVELYQYVDVGIGAECYYAVTRRVFMTAVKELKDEYSVLNIRFPGNPDLKILSKDRPSHEEVKANYKKWLYKRLRALSMRNSCDLWRLMKKGQQLYARLEEMRKEGVEK